MAIAASITAKLAAAMKAREALDSETITIDGETEVAIVSEITEELGMNEAGHRPSYTLLAVTRKSLWSSAPQVNDVVTYNGTTYIAGEVITTIDTYDIPLRRA